MTIDLMIDPHAQGAPREPCEDPARRLLECLERPDFFCGQHLTDQDLDAIIKWTRGRLRLSRLREGWGVVCGLNVSVDTSTPRRPLLRVTPGYAVDGCGDDIVACDAQCNEIWKHCSVGVPLSNCEKTAESESIHALRGGLGEESSDWDWNKESKNLRAVDLYVSFDEERKSPTLRSKCSSHGKHDCEYSRWRESADLIVRPATEPCAEPCKSDNESFSASLDVISAFESFYLQLPKIKAREQQDKKPEQEVKDPEQIRRWFRSYIDGRSDNAQQSAQVLPFLRLWIEKLSTGSLQKPEVHAEILFYLILDQRLRAVASQCPTTREPGVRLARVWLYAPENSTCCSVVGIDTQSPYRREFGKQTCAEIAGMFNLASVFGLPACDATQRLKEAGFEDVTLRELQMPNNLESLRNELSLQELCVDDPKYVYQDAECRSRSAELVLAVDPLLHRVVDFGTPPVAESKDSTHGGEHGPAVMGKGDEEAESAGIESDEMDPLTTDSATERFEELLKSDAFAGIKEARAHAILGIGITSLAQLAAMQASDLETKMNDWAKKEGKSLGHVNEGEYAQWIRVARAMAEFLPEGSDVEADSESPNKEGSSGS